MKYTSKVEVALMLIDITLQCSENEGQTECTAAHIFFLPFCNKYKTFNITKIIFGIFLK